MKQCPKCKNRYDDTHHYCALDGAKLMLTSNPKSAITKRRIATCLIIFGCILVLVITFHSSLKNYIIKLAASNCTVSLSGFSFDGLNLDHGVLSEARKIFDDLFRNSGNNKKTSPSGQSQMITLFLNIQNKNPFSITIEAIKIKVYVNSRKIGDCKLPSSQKTKIGVWQTEVLELPMDISFLPLLSTTGKIITSEKITYNLTGEVVIKTFIGRINYPLNVSEIKRPANF